MKALTKDFSTLIFSNSLMKNCFKPQVVQKRK